MLQQLLAHEAPWPQELTGLAADSRQVKPGDVFVALKSASSQGQAHIREALSRGASWLLLSDPSDKAWPVPAYHVPALDKALGHLAAKFYQQPSHDLDVIAVTGTCGKTSVCHLTAQLAEHLSKRCGFIGTLGWGALDSLEETGFTSPDALTLQRILSKLRALDWVAMEASSHALVQHRLQATRIKVAVFTNLSHEHLDYHGTMQAYGEAKMRLFTDFAPCYAVINLADPFGLEIQKRLEPGVSCVTYGHRDADYHLEIISDGEAYMKTPLGDIACQPALSGSFNASNMAATVAALACLGVEVPQVVSMLAKLRAVPGRMQWLPRQQGPAVCIDYAHKPAALEKILVNLKQRTQGQLWCVFGCGGDRDRAKRAQMGRIACRYADKIVITNDNPRRESPEAIVDDILAGCDADSQVQIVFDRRHAIMSTVAKADCDDVIVIAGKGHELQQQFADKTIEFSDKDVALEALDLRPT